MKRYLLISSFMAIGLQAQSTLSSTYNSTGGTLSNTAVSVEYALGEVLSAPILAEGNTSTVLIGILQPRFEMVTQAYEPSYEDQVKVFPNPTQGLLYVEDPKGYTLSLHSVDGSSVQVQPQGHSLDLSNIPAGIYMLRVFDADSQLLSFSKISKY